MASAEVIQYNLKFTLSEDQTFYYVKKADGVEIGYELRIPAEIEGLPVKEIEAEGFAGDTSINIVIIPESVIAIGGRAFKDCTGLQGIVIPRTVENYGRKIFENVPKTFRILHSEFETSILNETDDRLAFTLSDDETFYYVKAANRSISGDIVIPAEYNGLPVKEIDDWGFYYTGIETLSIEDGVETIGNSALYYCSSLTTITIPSSVTSIEEFAFLGCGGLNSIVVDSNNTVYKSIENCLIEISTYKLIRGCNTSTIPDNIKLIGDYAFSNCTSLTSINIPNSVTSIGDNAFSWCSALTSVTIPDSVTTIADYTFYYCEALTDITIPDNVTSIRLGAFEGCSMLTSIIIPDNVTSIGDSAFERCTALTSINIPDGVTTIGEYMLAYCSSLTSINIPDNVTSIGDYAFRSCSKLTTIDIPDSVTSIGSGAFHGCSFTSITIPDGVTSIENSVFSWCTALTSITIPNGVTSIGREAFYHCEALTDITIPDGVTSIEDSAFRDCYALTSINIPDGVTSIEDSAFRSCENLVSINLGGITSIPESCFSNCLNLNNVVISSNVTYIGSLSFNNCSALSNFTLESTTAIPELGSDVFTGCNNLAEVKYTVYDAYKDMTTWNGKTLTYAGSPLLLLSTNTIEIPYNNVINDSVTIVPILCSLEDIVISSPSDIISTIDMETGQVLIELPEENKSTTNINYVITFYVDDIPTELNVIHLAKTAFAFSEIKIGSTILKNIYIGSNEIYRVALGDYILAPSFENRIANLVFGSTIPNTTDIIIPAAERSASFFANDIDNSGVNKLISITSSNGGLLWNLEVDCSIITNELMLSAIENVTGLTSNNIKLLNNSFGYGTKGNTMNITISGLAPNIVYHIASIMNIQTAGNISIGTGTLICGCSALMTDSNKNLYTNSPISTFAGITGVVIRARSDATGTISLSCNKKPSIILLSITRNKCINAFDDGEYATATLDYDEYDDNEYLENSEFVSAEYIVE